MFSILDFQVISGAGARNYYRRLGYQLAPGAGGFMMKTLRPPPPQPPLPPPGWRPDQTEAAVLFAAVVVLAGVSVGAL